jgi:trk system potassium uptake protein TrkA
MYIIIGGGGQIGYYVTKGLLAQGHEVLLLDKDPRRVQTLTDELGSAVLRGDACEARTMDEVGGSRADIVIAVTGDDEDNLVICQMAKERFHVRTTIARVNNPKNEHIFAKLGIDITVSPTKTILHLIETEIPHHTVIPLMTLRRAGLGLVEVSVPPQSPALGKKLSALKLPGECNVVLIVRGQEDIVPSGESIIQAEDQVFALVKGPGEAALREAVLGSTSS